MAGDSAGGGLAVALFVATRDAGQALPAAAVLMSPTVDLTGSGASMTERADQDPILGTSGAAEATERTGKFLRARGSLTKQSIEQPIVLAPMVAVPRLAAAVSNAGALGMLTLTWSEDVGAVVRETAALTARPFCGNLVLTEDRHRRLDQALNAGLRIASFFLGDPSGNIEQVHDAGGIVMHTVGSAEEARRAVASGVDVVVARGWEAGGHVWGTVATLPLVPAVVDAVAPVPVIAVGGIDDARGVAAVLALGAQAAWLGTRFLLAEEMPIHEDYRRRLIAATETDPQRYPNLYSVGWPDSPHRALRNSTADAWQAAGRPHSRSGRERAR